MTTVPRDNILEQARFAELQRLGYLRLVWDNKRGVILAKPILRLVKP